MTKIKAKTEGKLLLCGEHIVFQGSQALGLPINQYSLEIMAEIEPTFQSHSSIEFVTQIKKLSTTLAKFAKHCERMIQGSILASIPAQHYRMHLQGTLPLERGFGSSAALCLTVAKILYATYNQVLMSAKDELLEFAHKLEHFFHGSSSGIDILLVAHESPILLEPAAKDQSNATLGFHITKIPPTAIPALLVGHTKRDIPTSHSVNATKKILDTLELKSPMLFATKQIAEIFRKASDFLNTAAIDELARHLTMLQACMQKAGLVSSVHSEIANACIQHGAHCFKTSGAGNGGAFFVLCQNKAHAVQLREMLQDSHYPIDSFLIP